MENLTAFADYLLTIYLLRSSLILFILMVPYYYIFSKEVTFLNNRVYLIATIMFTLVLPLIELPIYPVYMQMSVKTTDTIHLPKEQIFTNYQYFMVGLATIYLLGVIVMLSKFFYHLYLVFNKINTSEIVHDGNYKLVIDKKGNVASFFNFIFLNTLDTPKEIIDHEKVHAKHLHSLDILITEVLKCILWFHPFTYMLTNHIKLNHEYFCDATMVNRYGLATYADCILSYRKDQKTYSLCNHFFSFTKKRITMMNILKNNPKKSHKYLLMIPILLSVFSFFSFKSYVVPVDIKGLQQSDTIKSDVVIIVDTVYTEIVDKEGKKCKTTEIRTNEYQRDYYEKTIASITYVNDTFIVMDPKTFDETVTVVERKLSKIYSDLIENEMERSKPNFELIKKWQKEGEVK